MVSKINLLPYVKQGIVKAECILLQVSELSMEFDTKPSVVQELKKFYSADESDVG